MKSKETYFNIFVVEDNKLYSFMVDYILSKDNSTRIHVFHSAAECINANGITPDIIILDHYLGDNETGLAQLSNIKAKYKQAKILILSSQKDMDIMLDYLKNGITDYVVKNDDALQILPDLVDNIKNQKPENPKNILRRWLEYFL